MEASEFIGVDRLRLGRCEEDESRKTGKEKKREERKIDRAINSVSQKQRRLYKNGII
jgi:hypothetical protein